MNGNFGFAFDSFLRRCDDFVCDGAELRLADGCFFASGEKDRSDRDKDWKDYYEPTMQTKSTYDWRGAPT